MILNVNRITLQSSQERINEHYYTQRQGLIRAVSNTNNARKKYVNIETLSRSDILPLLDSIERDDTGNIENIMNDSDTEFVAEDESVISTNLIRK